MSNDCLPGSVITVPTLTGNKMGREREGEYGRRKRRKEEWDG